MNQRRRFCVFLLAASWVWLIAGNYCWAEEKMADLYILSVGVEPELSAQGKRDWYAQDAQYVRKALVAAEPLYDEVHSRVLNGKRATRASVREGLAWLANEAQKQDVVIIFFSAHGDMDSSKGYFISLAKSGDEHEDDGLLWGAELNKALAKIKTPPIVLVDTCRSGGLVSPETSKQHSAAIIAACGHNEFSSGQWERPDRPHGFFVIALCEALMGLADKDQNRVVTLKEVADYLPARAKAFYPRQSAVLLRRPELDSVPLSRVDFGYTLEQLWTPQASRNPFGEPDVHDPDGADVRAFAVTVKLPGDAKDPNAAQWSKKESPDTRDLLDGEWSSRWNSEDPATPWSTGLAQVKSVGERVYILYQEKGGNAFLIDACRVGKDLLVGRYVNLNVPDSTPWVGRIIDPERIDGQWNGGRWDLRRKLP